MLILPQSVYDQLRRHGEFAYPEECCGVLVGTFGDGMKIVRRAVATRNASLSPNKHYAIDFHELISVIREARVAGYEVVGFYHSHPNHPALWSQTDFAEAHWIGCSYLITEVVGGVAETTNAFCLAGCIEEDKRFEAEEIVIADRTAKGEGEDKL